MKRIWLAVGCLVLAALTACAPRVPASSQGSPATELAVTATPEPTSPPVETLAPTRDLRSTSAEFELEITGGDEALTQIPDIALDKQGNLLVIDGTNDKIRTFDASGKSLGEWGNSGEGDGQFRFKSDVAGVQTWAFGALALDTEGNVYVADTVNCRIQKLGKDGQFLAQWGECGTADGQFAFRSGVAVDSESHVYVTDAGQGVVHKFSSEGQFITKWPHIAAEYWSWTVPAVDQEGNLYVPSDYGAEVHKYSGDGELLMTIGERGQGDGEFIKPVAVALDYQGNVYVADMDSHRIQKFDANGNFLSKWGSRGSGPGEFRSPMGLVVGADGTVYVADWGGQRVQKFRQQ